MLLKLKLEIMEYMLKVQVEHVVEDIAPSEYGFVGEEMHADVEQFGSGGIPLAQGSARRRSKSRNKDNKPVVGGVKKRSGRRKKR